jgi:hypothetical protein
MPSEPAVNLFSLLRDYTKVHALREPAGDLSAFDLDGSKNLVRESVDRTLSELGFYPSTTDREALLDRSHEQFLKVLSDRTHLDEALRDLAVEMVRMREKSAYRCTEEEPAPEPEESPAPASDRGALQAYHEMLEDERAKILEEVKSAKDERIHLLQRRITKLSAKLREMEEVLARAGSADEPDSGIASEYRGVQGLGAGSAHYEDKKNALEKLFECNLNLRKMSAGSV